MYQYFFTIRRNHFPECINGFFIKPGNIHKIVDQLGLFDDATAMTKFQTWHNEHEANITRRSDEHRKTQRAKKAYTPIVKKVEVKQEAASEGTAEAAEA